MLAGPQRNIGFHQLNEEDENDDDDNNRQYKVLTSLQALF